MTPNQWILSDDTGTSSITIWAVMMGEYKGLARNNIPHDPSDFGRCYRLLAHFPKWRERLIEVGNVYQIWMPMIERWDEMERLWEEESPSGKCPKLYKLMRELYEPCMIAGGWTKTGPSSWEKKA